MTLTILPQLTHSLTRDESTSSAAMIIKANAFLLINPWPCNGTFQATTSSTPPSVSRTGIRPMLNVDVESTAV